MDFSCRLHAGSRKSPAINGSAAIAESDISCVSSSMISHSHCNFLMDWEPAEGYGMDVDEKGPVDVPMYMTQEPFSSDCDVYMAPTTPAQQEEVHMASPILTSQPPIISEIDCSSLRFSLPPLEMKMKPIVFPPFNIHAVPRQALESRISPRKTKLVSLDDSSSIYVPAIATYQAESPAMSSASSQGDTYTSAVHNRNHFPSKPVYCPVAPLPAYYIPTLQGVSPILTPVMPIDILEMGDTRAATPSPLVESSSSAEWPDRMADSGDIAPSVVCTPWIDEQDITPSTPRPVVAETNAPERTVDEDATPLSPILEATTPFDWPEITISQQYFDWGVDLINLSSPDFDSPNSDKDDSILRAFGGSSLEDLDWILDGFHATSVADACNEYNNSFEAMFVPAHPDNFSPVSPYDWVVSEAGPDLISFDSAHDLRHNMHSCSFELPSDSGDVIQTESNGLFQTSTPAPYSRSAYEGSPDVQSHSLFDPFVIFSKVAYTVERNAPRSTKTDASTQTEELPAATYRFRPPRRYSPCVRYSPYRKLSRRFTFGSSGSGDLKSIQPTITSGTSCGLPSPVDNDFLDCGIQVSINSERELEATPVVCVNLREPEEDDQEKEMTFPGAYPIEQVVHVSDEPARRELEGRPAVCVNLKEPEEDDQEKEMTFPGAYPVEQVVYALNEPAKFPARRFVKVPQKNYLETEVFPCPTVYPSVRYGFKELFFKISAYLFHW